jgi:hypothetical protein
VNVLILKYNLPKLIHLIKSSKLLLITFALILPSITLAILNPNVARASLPNNTATNNQTPIEEGDKNSGCEVGFVGSFFCHTSHILSKFADGLFSVLKHLLYVSPISTNSDGGKELYKIWNSFRSIANVVFILIFLVIIWSHLTGMGVSNYNIKRMLPRLVVNIVLVNVSFYVCVVIVDISNVAGGSIKSVMDGIASSINYHPMLSGWGNITALILGGLAGAAVIAAVIYIFAASLLPLAIGGIIAIFTIVLILIARQALIITLIIISPLAFALNVLPNTQKWFSKWWNALITVAIIYPLVALAAGGGSVIANIIRGAAGTDSGIPTMIFALLGMAAEVMPLFIIPKLIKSSSNSLSSISNAASKISKGSLRPVQNRSSEWANRVNNERRINSMSKRGPMGTYARARASLNYKSQDIDKQLAPGNESTGRTAHDQFVSDNKESLAKSAASDIKDPSKKQARQTQAQEAIEGRIVQLDIVDIEAAEAVADMSGLTIDDHKKIAYSNPGEVSDAQRAASFRKIGKSGDENNIEEAFDQLSQMKGDLSNITRALADGIDKSGIGQTSPHLNPTATSKLRNDPSIIKNGKVMDTLYKDAAESGRYNPSQMTKMNSSQISRLESLAPSMSQQAQSNLNASKNSIVSDPKLRSQMGAKSLRALSGSNL